jgi:hypothetical protein
MLVALITGHGPFEKHLHKMAIQTSSLCQQCLEEEETVEHFMCDCPAFERIRWKVFSTDIPYGKEVLNKEEYARILQFMKMTGRFN